jgi:predicted metal-dependent phosphoesterase TrpH/glycosyltransferase involved in cell wall biosynthesis
VSDRFAIAQVTPYPWDTHHEVNEFVARSSAELAARGHRVLIVAPSHSQSSVREARKAIRSAANEPASLLPRAGGAPRVISVGEVVSVPGRGHRGTALPIDVARTVEELLGQTPLDFVHVHEPFAPSVASAALRHSLTLNVGTFHAPTERLVSTQMARKVVRLLFGRLDARTASFATTAELMDRHFPADYRVVMPGADAPATLPQRDPTVRIVFAEEEERPALRLFLRALRRLDLAGDWDAVVLSGRGPSSSIPLREELRERVRFVSFDDHSEAELLAGADVLVCASDGALPAPGLLLRALAAGVVPLASRLPAYEEALSDGELGLLYEPKDVDLLSAQLSRLVGDREETAADAEALRSRLREAATGRRDELDWTRVADELEDVYATVAARRHSGRGDAALRRKISRRKLIDVDLHMHTDHSPDCATPVEVLLATAEERGLGAIAVTDHNVITGALEAREKAEGVKVIVAEEVKTANQGEVIGLFIEEHIPRGMTMEETVAEIKRQGGLVYVPHPFDRLHAVPDYEHLLTILPDVDAIEIYNPRVAIGSFNEEAARFAAKYRLTPAAGSDSHVAQGLGSVRIRMHDFDGPEEFRESLRSAEIITKPKSLLYVQALKFLETKATPPAARRARRERRVRRATRKA